MLETSLSVIFIGARRCGKSSTLASMIAQLDSTDAQIKVSYDDSTTDNKMRQKRAAFRKIFENTGNGFWNDSEESSDFDINQYRFNINIATHFDVDLECIDIPGEKIVSDLVTVNNLIKEANVIIIAIDTPQLMENYFMGKIANKVDNVCDVIKSATTDIYNDKLFLFVPIKCEKYVHSNRMGEVEEQVRKAYSPLISFLKETCKESVRMVPVQTLGDLEFSHFEMAGGQQIAQYKYVGNCNYSPRWCEQPIIYALEYAARHFSWPTEIKAPVGIKVKRFFGNLF